MRAVGRGTHRRNGRLAVAAAAAMVAALGLGACASGEPAVESHGSTGTLTYAVDGNNLSAHMDPHATQLDIGALVQRPVFDSLVFQRADGEIVPWLASEWEVAEDGLTYTFTLRDDVTFHDGTPFDAAAVVANLEHVVAPETASAQAAAAIGFDSEDPAAGAYVGATAIDEHTVEVEFRRPFVTFLSAMATTNLGMISPTVLADNPTALKAGGPGVSVGTGPYVLTELVADQQITYTANADYAWGPDYGDGANQGVPAFETLIARIVPEESVRIGAFNSEDVDAVVRVSPEAVVDVTRDAEVTSVTLPGLPYSLYLNTSRPNFEDPRVREAFRLSLNIDDAVEQVFGGQIDRAWSILAPATPNSYDASIEGSWSYDPDAAAALLDEAGWSEFDSEGYRVKDGERLSLVWAAWTPVKPENAALADRLQQDLRDAGIELVREQLEPAQYNEKYATLDFDLTDWGFASVDADVLRNHLHTSGFQNASAVSNPELDGWLEEAVASSDPAVRQELYTQVQQWNEENVAIVPLYLPAVITVVGPTVASVQFDIDGRPLWATATH